ncbi:MAG: penicillin-binding protein 2 [Anaerolineae bacterium]|nr:penicillin-binding protein 2 [Anaerolineae bacterium]NUQ03993.1 penicillin-binding protein 2 [Anaerolineae bacterium]
MATSATFPQQQTLRQRLPIVVLGLIAASLVLAFRLLSFQFPLDAETQTYLNNLRDSGYSRTLQLATARGNIYDRHGEAMAVNTLEYRVGISPALISDPRETATQMAAIINVSELELFDLMNQDVPWVQVAANVSADQAAGLRALNLDEITLDTVPRRSYPQGPVAAQVIGFVAGDLRGYFGVEGHYNSQLAGEVRTRRVSNIPFEVPLIDFEQDRGKDILLTIDRDVQFVVESELISAIDRYDATGGTIIVMNPRNGDILAMASFPSFDPNTYDTADARVLTSPAIGQQFEPGSIFKVLTVASGLETGAVTPDFTYNDQGSLGGACEGIRNWDGGARGVVDVTQILVQSLNVGTATISTRMGATDFYSMMGKFGIGRLTGVDLEGEQAGQLPTPGDPIWNEKNLCTNSFGQGVAVTPLQMLTAVNAIANGGLMMQPRVVFQILDGDEAIPARTANLGRPISTETAGIVTDMMVAVVDDGLDGAASLSGYSIAGKTGTAEIPTPIGYEQGTSIASFVGFFPADDPQVSILVKLDRPAEYWGSQTAAPTFRQLAERLVILLEIPTDDVRLALQAQGGSVNHIRR